MSQDLCTIVLTREEAQELYDDLSKKWHSGAQSNALVRDLGEFLENTSDFEDDNPTWPGLAASRQPTPATPEERAQNTGTGSRD